MSIQWVLTPHGEKINREVCDLFGFPDAPTKAEGFVLEAIWHKLCLLYSENQVLKEQLSEQYKLSQAPTESKAEGGADEITCAFWPMGLGAILAEKV